MNDTHIIVSFTLHCYIPPLWINFPPSQVLLAYRYYHIWVHWLEYGITDCLDLQLICDKNKSVFSALHLYIVLPSTVGMTHVLKVDLRWVMRAMSI